MFERAERKIGAAAGSNENRRALAEREGSHRRIVPAQPEFEEGDRSLHQHLYRRAEGRWTDDGPRPVRRRERMHEHLRRPGHVHPHGRCTGRRRIARSGFSAETRHLACRGSAGEVLRSLGHRRSPRLEIQLDLGCPDPMPACRQQVPDNGSGYSEGRSARRRQHGVFIRLYLRERPVDGWFELGPDRLRWQPGSDHKVLNGHVCVACRTRAGPDHERDRRPSRYLRRSVPECPQQPDHADPNRRLNGLRRM